MVNERLSSNELIRVVFNDWYIRGSVDEYKYLQGNQTPENKKLVSGRGFIVSVPQRHLDSRITLEEYTKLEKHFGLEEYQKLFTEGLLENKIILLGEGWIHTKNTLLGPANIPQVYLTQEFTPISKDLLLPYNRKELIKENNLSEITQYQKKASFLLEDVNWWTTN